MSVDGQLVIIESDSIICLDLALDPTVNFAMQQNDVPIVKSLKILNETEAEVRDLKIRIWSEPEFFISWETQVASVAAGGTYNLGEVDLILSPDYLLNLSERVAGVVHAEISQEDGILCSTTERIEILAHDEWNGLRSLPEILAAFVLPNHPDVERILASAATLLGEWTGDSSLSGYQSKSSKRVLEIAAAIYATLQRQGLNYINPPASFEQNGQKIRLPHRIFENKMATCLDLAVLCAACLEQAGLFPLVIITKGHAFTGVWLHEECFADSASDDGLKLKKRIDLEEICVFETTTVTGLSGIDFNTAIQTGKRHLEELGNFCCVFDIQRCRKSRIRPLPISVTDGTVEIICAAHSIKTQVSLTPQAPDLAGFGQLKPAASDTSDSASPETPATRLDKWKRRLLDLTLRNRLLNFRESKKTLPIMCPDLPSLEDALADGEKFQIHDKPADMSAENPRSAQLHLQRTGQDALEELLKGEFTARRLHANLTKLELDRRLLEIYRDSRNSLEEGGASTLFLALGFLSWYETPASEQPRQAPIILIPVELERRSIQEGFRIRQSDEEARINTTLLELLNKDFELTIPISDPLPADEHGIDVRGVLTTFKQAIKDIDRWEVIEQAQIGMFSFTKYLMWRDLQMRTNDLMKNKVVAHLINRPTTPFPVDGSFPNPDTLDDVYPPEETFCPLSADSSQLAAVYASAEGKSFVLEGPPGTGKSQTITNLIAHCLANGKTVLFVSEKMAALNVVHSRLKQIGLAPFCLELHSNKSHKLEIIQQLNQSLEHSKTFSPDQWQREAKRLAAMRSDLNTYVYALHEKRETGESLFQGVSRLIGLRELKAVDLGWVESKEINRESLERMREVLDRLSVAAQASEHPKESVWRTTDFQDWTPALEREIQALLAQAESSCNRLGQAMSNAEDLTGLGRTDASRKTYELAREAAQMLLDKLPNVTAPLLNAPDWPTLKEKINGWIEQGQRRDALMEIAYRHFTECLWTFDLTAVNNNLRSATDCWLKSEVFESSTGHKQDLLNWIEQDVKTLIQNLANFCQELLVKSQAIAPFMSIPANDWSLPIYSYVHELAGIFLETPATLPPALLTEPDWESTRYQIQSWIEHGRKRDAIRKDLFGKYSVQLLTLDLQGLHQKLSSANSSWFMPRLLGRMSVSKNIRAVSLNGKIPAYELLLKDLEQSIALHTEEELLQKSNEQAKRLLSIHWNESNADWDAIEKLLSWCTLLRNMAAKAAGNSPEKSAALREKWARMFCEGHDRFSPKGDIGQMLLAMRAAFCNFSDTKKSLETTLCQTPEKLWGDLKLAGVMTRIRELLSEWETQVSAICTVRAALKAGKAMSSHEELSSSVLAAIELKTVQAILDSVTPQATQVLMENWQKEKTNWNHIEKMINDAEQLWQLSEKIGYTGTAQSENLRSTWSRLITNEHAQFKPEGALYQRLYEIVKAHGAFEENLTALQNKLTLDAESAWGDSKEFGWLSHIFNKLTAYQKNIPDFRAWCHWRAIRNQANEEGLASIVTAYENKEIVSSQFIASFERSYYQWWTEQAIQKDSRLRGFFSPEFERKIEQFRDIDERYTQLARAEVQARLAAKAPAITDSAAPNSEMGILRHQVQRKRGHLPVRQLFQKIPNLLPRLKPCLLMSPISVAQYLDAGHAAFDLVIFDEASQIPIWDAVGAIARGSQAVIVGDPKQLPPTNFFSRTDDENFSEDDVVEDLESILDDCIAAQLPWLQLRWHYRSRHESLITFSNYHYYENRLLTFPSPHRNMGVSLHMVQGQYDKGKSRTNRAEAQAVVAEVVHRLKDTHLSQQSIGIVTFSIAQQGLIEDLLEVARREHPEIDVCFNYENGVEPVFVKNLENVQGDERDVILFSICYGPDSEGRVSMNFGPLNRDGGERRLNVAITRARREVVVFSTLRADQIDLARTRARGVRDLKYFLDYAERGPVAIAEALSLQAKDEFDSPFEKQACESLRHRGYEVHAQVGCSGYRIDLGIVDQESPGRYILGIECDGANYHRAKTARDRDRLRECVLNDLGWTLHRIWSTDWWENPQKELDRIETALERARKNSSHVPAQTNEKAEMVVNHSASSSCSAEHVAVSVQAQQDATHSLLIYTPYTERQLQGNSQDFFNPLVEKTIQRVIEEVIGIESPISLNLLARRVASLWEIKKINDNTRTRVDLLAQKSRVLRQVVGVRVFFWSMGYTPETYQDFRVPGSDVNSKREALDLPAEEIANAALYALSHAVSVPLTDLVRETARLLGYQRTGSLVESCILKGIKILYSRNCAIEREGMVIHKQ